MTRRDYHAGEICQMLAQAIDRLVPDLLPNATVNRQEWQVGDIAGNVSRHGPGHGSMLINRGARPGVWQDFATGGAHKGDALDLVNWVLFGGAQNKTEAIKWARSWLGLPGFDREAWKTMEVRRAQARELSEQRKLGLAADERKRRGAARWIFTGAEQVMRRTPVHHYLEGRRIHFDILKRFPGAIRWHQDLKCMEDNRRYHAMVACISGPLPAEEQKDPSHVAQGILAVHRTYLAQQEHDPETGELYEVPRWVKAPLGARTKKTLGSWFEYGGSIRLWRGASGRPLSQAPDGEWVAIAEGIETSLSIAMGKPELRIVCGVDLGGMGQVWLPPQIAGVYLHKETVVQRADEPDAAFARRQTLFEEAFARVVIKHQEAGRAVKIVRAASGSDFNDVLANNREEVEAA